MRDKIQEQINFGNYDKAALLLEEYFKSEPIYDDVLAILAATIEIERKNYDEAFESIRRGLKYNYKNYELYFMMGNIYERLRQLKRAYLCYENAVYFCKNEDINFLKEYKTNFQEIEKISVPKVAIVIVSYNNLEYTQFCIKSIRDYTPPEAYEIIIVDNHSTDGTVEWLNEQKDLKVILNSENMGFPIGCNQGIQEAELETDILLLNNDTIVMANSIFTMRMGLYENERIGAIGAVSNCVGNEQKIGEDFDRVEDYFIYAQQNNICDDSYSEYKIRLIGFAMLIKRKVLNVVGGLDEQFTPGYYEDDDISLRILKSGYILKVRRDCFIFHFGGRSFHKNTEDSNKSVLSSVKKFYIKWGIELAYYAYTRMDLIQMIDEERNRKLKILEVGCGCGATLLKVKSMYPNAEVYGIELNNIAAQIAGYTLDIIVGDIETLELSYDIEQFDYIIFGDVLEHTHNPLEVLKKVKRYLKADGKILASIPNILHKSVIIPLLKGQFTYQDSGILDKTHLRFFTCQEIVKLFHKAEYNIIIQANMSSPEKEEEKFLDQLCSLEGVTEKNSFLAYQYIIKAKKNL